MNFSAEEFSKPDKIYALNSQLKRILYFETKPLNLKKKKTFHLQLPRHRRVAVAYLRLEVTRVCVFAGGESVYNSKYCRWSKNIIRHFEV